MRIEEVGLDVLMYNISISSTKINPNHALFGFYNEKESCRESNNEHALQSISRPAFFFSLSTSKSESRALRAYVGGALGETLYVSNMRFQATNSYISIQDTFLGVS